MLISDFDYEYPPELIAHYPLPERDASRMMVLNRADRSTAHSHIRDLPSFLCKGDVLVINDSRVFPARLVGRKETGGKVEVLLIPPFPPFPPKNSADLPRCLAEEKGGVKPRWGHAPLRGEGGFENRWRCITDQTAKLKDGAKIYFNSLSPPGRGEGEGLIGTIISRNGDELIIEFDKPELIEKVGLPPVPPYIRAARAKNQKSKVKSQNFGKEDCKRYQTIYAKYTGSAAAPTAGLHFTDGLLQRVGAAGVEIVPITLHVGLDTFSPVRTKNIEDHKMHGEEYFISGESVEKISCAKEEGRRVVAVGTTCVRALESACGELLPPHPRHYSLGGQAHPLPRGERGKGEGLRATRDARRTTHLFIRPGHKFKMVDAILTNFHQPKSTLLMMVFAFATRELTMKAYREAIAQKYRLFSYGDCMLII